MVIKKKILVCLITLMCLGICIVLFINSLVINKYSDRIISFEDAIKLEDIDAILVLGCKVNGTNPSMMLGNRLYMGIKLYNKMNTKLLLSGDTSTTITVLAFKKFTLKS